YSSSETAGPVQRSYRRAEGYSSSAESGGFRGDEGVRIESGVVGPGGDEEILRRYGMTQGGSTQGGAYQEDRYSGSAGGERYVERRSDNVGGVRRYEERSVETHSSFQETPQVGVAVGYYPVAGRDVNGFLTWPGKVPAIP
ncbi:MAG TPA: hypothetical protein VIO94_13295, partial [Phenylobacterium sp.]